MKTKRELVLEAWDNALENGYGAWLMNSEPVDIADNMMDCDGEIAAVFDLDYNALLYLVKKIQEEKKGLC